MQLVVVASLLIASAQAVPVPAEKAIQALPARDESSPPRIGARSPQALNSVVNGLNAFNTVGTFVNKANELIESGAIPNPLDGVDSVVDTLIPGLKKRDPQAFNAVINGLNAFNTIDTFVDKASESGLIPNPADVVSDVIEDPLGAVADIVPGLKRRNPSVTAAALGAIGAFNTIDTLVDNGVIPNPVDVVSDAIEDPLGAVADIVPGLKKRGPSVAGAVLGGLAAFNTIDTFVDKAGESGLIPDAVSDVIEDPLGAVTDLVPRRAKRSLTPQKA